MVARSILALVLFMAGMLSVSELQGQSLFSPSRLHFAVPDRPWAVESADFNGDGIPDLATASRSERRIAVQLGNGDGTFQDTIGTAVGISPRSFVPADFNGDGSMDLAVANLLSDDVTILSGAGDGTFGVPLTYPVGSAPRSIIAADLNGDGPLDLVIANRDSRTLSAYVGIGDGTFTAAPDVPTGNLIRPRQVRAAFLDSDTIPDLVVIHDTPTGFDDGPRFGVLLGNGDATFAPIAVTQVQPSVTEGFPESNALSLADLDGDGIIDLSVSIDNSTFDEVVTYLGDGNGAFSPAPGFLIVGNSPFFITHAEMTGDGVIDLLVLNTGSNALTLHPGNGDGSFTNSIPGGDLFDYTEGTYRTGHVPRWLTRDDFDGDGRIDIAVANEEGNDVAILLNRGDGQFRSAPRFGVGSPPQAFPIDGDAADLDGDGDIDLAIANWGRSYQVGEVSVLLNRGDGSFAPRVNYPAGVNPRKAIAGEFTGDGIGDLAVLNERDTVISVLPGAGGGAYGAAISLNLKSTPGRLRSVTDMTGADLDGDGRRDLAVVNRNEDALAIFRNGPSGLGTDPVVLPVTARPGLIRHGDMDGNGTIDLVVQRNPVFQGERCGIDVFLNDGGAVFGSAIAFELSDNRITDILVGEFTGDGHPDVALIEEDIDLSQSVLHLLAGQGDGTLQPLGSRGLTDPGALAALDLVGSALPDILVSSYPNADVTVLENLGDGQFVERAPSYGLPVSVRRMVAGDFDGDGRTDLAGAGGIFGDSAIAVLFNRGGVTAIAPTSDDAGLVQRFHLEQNYPNPFNPSTTIRFGLPEAARVTMAIFDALGRRIVRARHAVPLPAGWHEFTWDGRDEGGRPVASGVYLYRMTAGEFTQTRKMVLMR